MADDERSEERKAWDELVTAARTFINALPEWDRPRIVHCMFVIENKDTQQVYALYPMRLVREEKTDG